MSRIVSKRKSQSKEAKIKTFQWNILEVLLLGVLNCSGGLYELFSSYKCLFECD